MSGAAARCLVTANSIHSSLKKTYRLNALSSYRLKNKLSSPFTLHPSLKKRAAFTLAEVLITLGIIGVVAAMTLPTVIAKYQHKALETAFKKTYSSIMQAMVFAEPDLISDITGGGVVGGNSEFYTKLWERYNVVKNMTDIDYTVETEFSYENDQLKRTTTTTEYALAAATSDKQVLLDKESSCQRLAATLSNTTGMSANCRLEEDKQTIIQTIDYAQLDLSYITDHIAEFEGFYPEYELNEDIDTIQTSMEQAGYTCTDTQR